MLHPSVSAIIKAKMCRKVTRGACPPSLCNLFAHFTPLVGVMQRVCVSAHGSNGATSCAGEKDPKELEQSTLSISWISAHLKRAEIHDILRMLVRAQARKVNTCITLFFLYFIMLICKINLLSDSRARALCARIYAGTYILDVLVPADTMGVLKC